MARVRAQIRGPLRSLDRQRGSERTLSRVSPVARLRPSALEAVSVRFRIFPGVSGEACAAHVLELVRDVFVQHVAGTSENRQQSDVFCVGVFAFCEV